MRSFTTLSVPGAGKSGDGATGEDTLAIDRKSFACCLLRRGRGLRPCPWHCRERTGGSTGDASEGGLQTRPAGRFPIDVFCYAVVKVPPSVGCVKYKAQDIVLSPQIRLLQRLHGTLPQKPPILPVEFFAAPRHLRKLMASFRSPFRTSTRLGVCETGHKAQPWCRDCGAGWESGKDRASEPRPGAQRSAYGPSSTAHAHRREYLPPDRVRCGPSWHDTEGLSGRRSTLAIR